MPARLHPGVYVEEVPGGARSIEAASTSTAILVGETERGPITPIKIKGKLDYERIFGGYLRFDSASSPNNTTLRYAVDAFFGNGGGSAYILRAIAPDAVVGSRTSANAKVIASSPGKWSDNVRAILCASTDGANDRFRIVVAYQSPSASAPSVVESWDRLSATATDENYVVDVLARSSFIRWDPQTTPAMPSTLDDSTSKPSDKDLLDLNVGNLSGGTGGAADLASSAYPALLERLDEITDASLLVFPAHTYDSDTDAIRPTNAALSYAENRPQRDLFVVGDLPRFNNQASANDASNAVRGSGGFGAISPRTDFGAVYFPWVEVGDPVGKGKDPTVFVCPSAFVAGLYARTDGRRGVWKAPAGLEATVLGVRRLQYNLLDAQQDDCNPIGLNLLRVQPAGGMVVWGARTLRPDTEWRYINVRRTAIFLRRSIYNGIQWAVFEPNDEPLWANLRLTIGAFMEQQFRQGAFAGRTTREAFFVKCDAETTPEADRVAGIVNVLVGFAPLRPAEFVVVRLSQIVNQKA